jgi:hypothetical protein
MSQNQKILGRPSHRNQFSPNLDRKLVAYAAAGAACAALFSSAQPAEAKIIYSNTNVRVGFRPIEIDLNHDGVPDFVISHCPFYHSEKLVVGPQVAGNAIQFSGGANAGFRGSPNGPANSFRATSADCFSSNGVYPMGITMATYFDYINYFGQGQWINTTNRYLGLKFSINGQTHYGWARLSIGILTGRLTGYAYETVPNTQIVEGATSDIAALEVPTLLDPVLPSPSLGMLARGIDALALWRRDYTPVAGRRDDPITG